MLDYSLTAKDFDRTHRQVVNLEVAVRKKTTAAGLREIAKPLRKDLAASLPVKSGALRDSIGYKKISRSRSASLGITSETAYEIGATRKTRDKSGESRYQTYKLRFLSYGTKPHGIKSKSGGALKFGSAFARGVDHPGIVGQDYVKNVYDKHQSHMRGLFVKGAMSVLQKHGVTTWG